MGATLLLVLAVSASTAMADLAADRCGGSKEKAAGRYGSKVINCHASAALKGESVDPVCTTKAFTSLSKAFAAAQSKGGCETTGDAAAVGASVTADMEAVAAALAPGVDLAARRCASTKMKASGKHYAGLLMCYAKGAARSEGPDSVCLTKATTKLTTQFSKAEAKGGCTTTADSTAIANLDSDGAENRVADVSPVCGDNVTGPDQTCDGSDDAACPGLCTATCSCTNCGDGVADLPEECDDNNLMDGDGCSSACVLENTSARCDGVATTAGTDIDAVLVGSFSGPVHATAPPLDPSRLFVVERSGVIRIVNLADDTTLATPFLDINDLVGEDGEGGLLSMAFDPDYETNRRFFVNYTNNSGHTTIARYETEVGDPNIADESSAQVLFVINQPYANHNGGQIAFGPDGYLYVGMGDGGGGGDPDETAQDDGDLLGKMLRVDVAVAGPPYYSRPASNPHYVDGTSDLELIWAKGLRNPWRFSFDRSTGDMLIGDVGQGDREEIDFQAAASTGGENYGWDIFEGSVCFEPDPAPMCPAPPTGFTMPIHEYDHGQGCSITGGFVYRGCAMPDLASQYFFSDYCGDFLRTVEISGGTAINPANRTGDAESAGANISGVVSFGEDARGEIYIVSQGGAVYRIEPE